MKSKLLTAYIIDQNPEQGREFYQIIKDTFGKIYIQNNLIAALTETTAVKPEVLFVNLSIEQRAVNLDLIEKLDIGSDKVSMIFGYFDKNDPELMAHAIETGVHDIFTRPYSSDIISSRINRFFKAEKNHTYISLSKPLPVQIPLKLKLTSVDENGLTFKSVHFIGKGTSFPVKSKLMEEIFEVEEVHFMVTKTWINDGTNEFFLYCEPKDTNEAVHASLRKFILRKI